ncbi:DNA polymerase III subunit beta [Nocardia sp. NPDC052001]|uniref:DNA polymerase III subunit beta n=1 Tax=Nocardia sp. NPDC052001 TaxID=3154853 RepID=UPI0034434C4D
MKIRVERDCLTEALSVVGPAVPRRPSVPVLAGIRLRAEANSASVAAFDYEISSHAAISGTEVSEPGEVLVSGRLLTEIAKSLPAHPVDLCDSGEQLEIVCGPARFTLPLMTAEDYPELPPHPPTTGTVDYTEFCDAVTQVAVAAGKDDTLPMLLGINLEFHADFLRLVSTDRFRIAIRELDWQPSTPIAGDEPASVLIPARALADTSRALSGSQLEIACGPARTVLGLASDSRRATLRTLDMAYAPYQGYLVDRRTATARFPSAALADAVKRVSLLSPRGAQVQLTCTTEKTRLTAGNDSEGNAEETIAGEFDGDPLTVAFNPRYLLDGLTAMRTETVELALNGPSRAAVLRPAHPNPAGQRDGFVYVLMPIRLP